MSTKFKRQFRQASCAFLVGSLIYANETTGYNGFDVLGAEFNLACAIDPTCRKLTEDQIELAREYFGDSIDYSTVNYFSRSPLWGQEKNSGALAISSFGNIYETDNDFYESAHKIAKDNVFIHEMIHVWQWQHGYLVAENQRRPHDNIYQHDINEYENFLDFGIEQQGVILQTIHANRFLLDDTSEINIAEICSTLNQHEEMAAQMLPIEITDCLATTQPVPEI